MQYPVTDPVSVSSASPLYTRTPTRFPTLSMLKKFPRMYCVQTAPCRSCLNQISVLAMLFSSLYPRIRIARSAAASTMSVIVCIAILFSVTL